MEFSTEAIVGFTGLFTSGCLILLFIWIFNQRRKRIIRMNNIATGTIVDVVERSGMKGNNYFESVIQYVPSTGQQISVRHFYTKKSSAFTKGQKLELYYDPSKPEKFVMKEDRRARGINLFFGVVGALLLLGALCFLLFL